MRDEESPRRCGWWFRSRRHDRRLSPSCGGRHGARRQTTSRTRPPASGRFADSLSYAESELGTMEVRDVRRRHVQALIDQLHESGVDPARIVAVTDALRGLYNYAIRRELVGFSPVVELDLPHRPERWRPADRAGARRRSRRQREAGRRASPGRRRRRSARRGHRPRSMRTSGRAPASRRRNRRRRRRRTHRHRSLTRAYERRLPDPGPPPTPPPYPPPYPTTRLYGRAPRAAVRPARLPDGVPAAASYAQPGYGTGQHVRASAGAADRTATSREPSAACSAPQTGAPTANYDATMQERWLWWTVRIIVIVFVLIALVLVAESV